MPLVRIFAGLLVMLTAWLCMFLLFWSRPNTLIGIPILLLIGFLGLWTIDTILPDMPEGLS